MAVLMGISKPEVTLESLTLTPSSAAGEAAAAALALGPGLPHEPPLAPPVLTVSGAGVALRAMVWRRPLSCQLNEQCS